MEHLDHELQDFCRIENSIFLLKYAIVYCLQIKQVVNEAKHQHDLELDHLQEVLDFLPIFRPESKFCKQFNILLD